MSEWLSQANYAIMLIQVIITLVVVPVISYKLLIVITRHYGKKALPSASRDLDSWLKQATRRYWSIVGVTFMVSLLIVLHAMLRQSELLNWDDESGLMILYLLAMVPLVVMVLLHRALFKLLKGHVGGTRMASLKVRRWQDYVSAPQIVLVVVSNMVLAVTVLYFVQHPFQGFAGLYNFIGQLFINLIFLGIIFAVYRDNKTNSIQHPEQRESLKKRSINVNLLIMSIALCHIALSIWIKGSDLINYKIIAQSLYFQVILLISAISLTLPKSVFCEKE